MYPNDEAKQATMMWAFGMWILAVYLRYAVRVTNQIASYLNINVLSLGKRDPSRTKKKQ